MALAEVWVGAAWEVGWAEEHHQCRAEEAEHHHRHQQEEQERPHHHPEE
jgi:hypothetical protein